VLSLAANASSSTYRPTTRYTTTTTQRPTTELVRHTTSSKSSEKKDNDCPGVCVADRIADYCEAYLRTPNLCKSGTKCCVAKDTFADNPDLKVLIGTQTPSKPQSKPQKTPEKV
jgi:plasma kallikrein